jgi:protoporphyrinogen oxidase
MVMVAERGHRSAREVVILGAGAAGLAAGHRLSAAGSDVLIIERQGHPGGTAASKLYGSRLIFDYGIHGLYTSDELVRNLLVNACDSGVLRVPVSVTDYFQGQIAPHPPQSSFPLLAPRLASSIAEEMLRKRRIQPGSSEIFSRWANDVFGSAFCEEIYFPYIRKFWAREPNQLTCGWVEHRLPMPTRDELMRLAEGQLVPSRHYVQEVLYPAAGGFGSFFSGLANDVDMLKNADILTIDTASKRITTTSGEVYYDRLLSTIPLPSLVFLMTSSDAEAKTAASLLKATYGVYVNIELSGSSRLKHHWMYVFDKEIPFARLSSPSEWSPGNAPEGVSTLQAEYYFSCNPFRSDRDLELQTLRSLVSMGIISPHEDPVMPGVMRLPYANVVYDQFRDQNVAVLKDFVRRHGVHLVGRYANWDYSLVDSVIRQAWQAVDEILGTNLEQK